MAEKRKTDPNQLVLPVAEPGAPAAPAQEAAPAESARAPKGQKAATPPAEPKKNGNGNGASHVLAEELPAAVVHRPFDPGKIELPLHRRVDRSFLEYASYVIRDRAIPNLADGLKPVQRRILWALHEKDDGRFIKVANVVGHTMQYHPHGDASIGDALVVLANKRYLIEGPGELRQHLHRRPRRRAALHRVPADRAGAHRAVQRRDHRVRAQLRRPQQGAGHAALQAAAAAHARHRGHRGRPGLAHPAAQLPRAARGADRHPQEAALQVPARFPDRRPHGRPRLQGRRAASVKVRAKIKVKDESTVVIKEIPPTTTTDSLIGSIEDAARKGKIKVKSINDFTSEEVEIEVQARRSGVSAEQLVDALYAFTDCEVTIASRIVVIRDNRPVEMTVSEVLRENTEQLVDVLKRELELKESKLQDETALPHAGAHLHRGAHLQEDRAVQDQRGRAGRRARGLQAVPQAVGSRADPTRTSSAC